MVIVSRCLSCGLKVDQPIGKGRPRLYCSSRCRMAALRHRRAAALGGWASVPAPTPHVEGLTTTKRPRSRRRSRSCPACRRILTRPSASRSPPAGRRCACSTAPARWPVASTPGAASTHPRRSPPSCASTSNRMGADMVVSSSVCRAGNRSRNLRAAADGASGAPMPAATLAAALPSGRPSQTERT